MEKSYAAGWASDAPTPAQLKEFFAQIASGRVTGKRLQDFLRGIDVTCSERGKGEAPVFSRDMEGGLDAAGARPAFHHLGLRPGVSPRPEEGRGLHRWRGDGPESESRAQRQPRSGRC